MPVAFNQCTVGDCGRPVVAHGWCYGHYLRWRKHGSPGTTPIRAQANSGTVKSCSHAGCDRVVRTAGMCQVHYKRRREAGALPNQKIVKCSVECCERIAWCKGLCTGHYEQLNKTGTVKNRPIRTDGVGFLDSNGYRIVSAMGHPNATRDGQIKEHRLVMSVSLGRPLLKHESVHHKNTVRTDNRLVKGHELKCPGDCCNLELWSKPQAAGGRVEDILTWMRSYIRQYESAIPDDTLEDDQHCW